MRFIVPVMLAAVAVAGAQSPPQSASQPTQTPTFRSGATIVPVDVRAFDSKGRPVTDLKREDFTVREDEVSQDISLFAATALSPVIPNLDPKERATPSADPAAGGPSFTVVHGNSLAPNPFRNLNGTPAFAPDLSAPNTNIAAADPATARLSENTPSAASRTVGQPPDAIVRRSFASIGAGSAATDQMVEKLNQTIDELKHNDGEKHIILSTSAPPSFNRAEDIDALAKAANDARVVIDVAQDGADGGWGVMDLERLAKLTGGIASIYSSPSKSQHQIEKANTFEYQLGYYPKDTTLDSRYRKISVTVNRPGIELAYRTGYYARKPALVIDPETRTRYNAVSRALRSSIPFQGLKVTATAIPYENDKERGVAVHITVAPDGIRLTRDNDVFVDSLDVAVIAANSRDALVGRAWDAVDLRMTEEEHQRFLAAGLIFDRQLKTTSSASAVKVVVYDPASGLTGSVMLPVKR